MAPEPLTLELFAGRVGEPFRLRVAEGEVLDLRLAEAISLGEPYGADHRAPFSIVFSGPPQPIVGQRIYPLDHDELGTLELFLVPIRPDAAGARYEAVFT